MKNRYLLSLMTLLALNLAIPVKMVANEPNNTCAQQQFVAEIFKHVTSDQERLQLLRAGIVNSLHSQDHNWFQRAANMTPEEEQKLTEEYICFQKDLEGKLKPLHAAIQFLEDKLAFERKQKEEQEKLAWEAGKEERAKQKEEREKQAKEEEKRETIYTIAGVGGFFAAWGAFTWIAFKLGLEF